MGSKLVTTKCNYIAPVHLHIWHTAYALRWLAGVRYQRTPGRSDDRWRRQLTWRCSWRLETRDRGSHTRLISTFMEKYVKWYIIIYQLDNPSVNWPDTSQSPKRISRNNALQREQRTCLELDAASLDHIHSAGLGYRIVCQNEFQLQAARRGGDATHLGRHSRSLTKLIISQFITTMRAVDMVMMMKGLPYIYWQLTIYLLTDVTDPYNHCR